MQMLSGASHDDDIRARCRKKTVQVSVLALVDTPTARLQLSHIRSDVTAPGHRCIDEADRLGNIENLSGGLPWIAAGTSSETSPPLGDCACPSRRACNNVYL